MTYPTCPTCASAYIPIPTLTGCPWCHQKPDPNLLTESWRERRNRKRREATAAKHA